MGEFFFLWGLFVSKLLTALLLLGLGLMLVAGTVVALRSEKKMSGKLVLNDLNQRYQDYAHQIQGLRDGAKALKAELKRANKKAKKDEKAQATRPVLFVVDFHGDLKASATDALSETINAVLQNFRDGDAVLLRLESAGGLVHAYGFATAQLQRLRAAGLHLTVCVDKVAASGGYMMAAVADRIVAAPFAVLGSVGVVAQLPNFNKLLKKNDIDIEYHTAGKYKRTLTLVGENSEEGRKKFIEDLDHTHKLFQNHLAACRQQVDVEAIATGEIWYGSDALARNLIDQLGTSDSFILEQLTDKRVVHISYQPKQNIAQKLGAAGNALANSWQRWLPF